MANSFGKRGLPREPKEISTPERPRIVLYAIAALAVAGVIFYLILTPRQPTSRAVVVSGPSTSISLRRTAMEAIGQAPSAAPTYPVITPATLCKERYPFDFDMRDTCVRVQDEAKLEVETIRIDDDVKTMCAERYIHDWSMYLTCAKQEMAAKLPNSEKPDAPTLISDGNAASSGPRTPQ